MTEADAYKLFERLRWDGAPGECPLCGAVGRQFFLNPANGVSRMTTRGRTSERRIWKCGHCRRHYSVLSGTIFQGTKVQLRTWLLVLNDYCAHRDTLTPWTVSRDYRLTPQTARRMVRLIQSAEPLVSAGGRLN